MTARKISKSFYSRTFVTKRNLEKIEDKSFKKIAAHFSVTSKINQCKTTLSCLKVELNQIKESLNFILETQQSLSMCIDGIAGDFMTKEKTIKDNCKDLLSIVCSLDNLLDDVKVKEIENILNLILLIIKNHQECKDSLNAIVKR